MLKDIADLFLNIRRKTSSLLIITNKVDVCSICIGGEVRSVSYPIYVNIYEYISLIFMHA